MKDEKAWSKLDDVVSAQLINYGDAGKRINILENVVYEEAVAMFGTEDRREKQFSQSRRQKQLGGVIGEITGFTIPEKSGKIYSFSSISGKVWKSLEKSGI